MLLHAESAMALDIMRRREAQKQHINRDYKKNLLNRKAYSTHILRDLMYTYHEEWVSFSGHAFGNTCFDSQLKTDKLNHAANNSEA